MSKSLRYVKDFEFPSEFGFSRSAGKQQVKGYARGGVGQGMMKKQGPQDGSGQRRGKGSFNREPMLKCGGKVKK